MIRHRDGFHLSLSVFSCFSGLLEMEAASVVIRAAEAVALAEEMEALDPLRTVLEPGQATEADEPLTLGSAQSPLYENRILLRGESSANIVLSFLQSQN